jgi:hypothetical protein
MLGRLLSVMFAVTVTVVGGFWICLDSARACDWHRTVVTVEEAALVSGVCTYRPSLCGELFAEA